jgi:hypothetical protein
VDACEEGQIARLNPAQDEPGRFDLLCPVRERHDSHSTAAFAEKSPPPRHIGCD